MVPQEDARPDPADRTGRPIGAAAHGPMRWIRPIGFGLFLGALLFAPESLQAGALSPWQTVEVLLCALGAFIYLLVPGALVVLGHPWAAARRQMLEQSFKHPRLNGLAQALAGVVVAAWAIALLLHTLPDPPEVGFFALVLAVVGLLALMVFDRRS